MSEQFNVIQESRFELPGLDLSSANVRYAILFIAGVFIGYFVFGLWLFPVRYTAVYPNELRADARDDYFQMVAESYALTQDLEQAAVRLRFWQQEELGPLLYQRAAALQATDPTAAQRLRTLAVDLRLTETGTLAGAETAVPPRRPLLSTQTLPVAGLLVLGLLLLTVVLLAFRYFNVPLIPTRRRGPAVFAPGDQVETDADLEESLLPTEEAEEVLAPERETEGPSSAEEEEAETPLPWELEEEEVAPVTTLEEEEEPWSELEEEAAEEGRTWEEQLEGEEVLTPPSSPTDELLDSLTRPARPLVTPLEGTAQVGLGEPHIFVFDGDPLYDRVYPIEERDTYLGEFGIGVSEVAPDDKNQVIALEVWLFDKSDIHTETLILVPPDVYHDEQQRAQLSATENAHFLPLQPEQEIYLSTEKLEVRGRVKRVNISRRIGRLSAIHHAEFELMGRLR